MAFLKSIDERVWQAVINGWKLPTIITGEKSIQKDVSEWDRVDYETCGWNSKAISAIFNWSQLKSFIEF